jgi:hypothetical protein
MKTAKGLKSRPSSLAGDFHKLMMTGIGFLVVMTFFVSTCLSAETGTGAEAPDIAELTPSTAASAFEASGSLGWNSRYVSEGVNWLEEGGIATAEGAVARGPFALGTWLAFGDSINYQESNVFATYSREFNGWRGGVGYNWIRYIEEETNDHQLAALVEWTSLPVVTPAVNYSYYTESEGGFLETSLSAEFHPLTNSLMLEPYLLAGFDFGYVSPEYDGANQFQVGIEGSYWWSRNIILFANAHHSLAWENLDQAGLGDQTWVGFGLRVTSAFPRE